MQGNGRTLFGSAFDYCRIDEPGYPLGHRPGQSYFGAETTYDLTQVVLNRSYIRRLKQLYYDKIDCSEEKVWGQRNGELTIKDYFNLSDQQRFVLERLHAIKDELKGAVNFKYVNLRDALVSSDDADDIARLEGLEAEKTELDNFLAGKTGVYNQYSFLCEVLKYHKAKYSGEKVDDEVLGAFLKEFSLNNEGLSIEDQKTIIESFHAIESIDASTKEGALSRGCRQIIHHIIMALNCTAARNELAFFA